MRKVTPLGDSFVENSLPGQFSLTAKLHGQREAINDGIRTLTYGELEVETDGLAHVIDQSAGERQHPVCLLLDQGIDLIVAILGVLKSGRAYVPLDRSDPPETIAKLISDSGCRLVLCDGSNLPFCSRVAAPGTKCLPIDVSRARVGPLQNVHISPDDEAYIYYTSGTTGSPKGVVDIHRNVLHNVLRYSNTLAIGPDDRLSLIQSSNFSGTVSTIFSALLNGAALFPFDFRRRGVAQLAQWIKESQVTAFHSVPVIFERLAEIGLQFPSIRLIRLEGDRMLPRHLELFKRHFGKDCILVNGLASTETGLIRQNFFTHESDNPGTNVPVGYPVKDMDVAIRLADGSAGKTMEIGEIVVRSPFLAKGYWRRPDLTAARFVGSNGAHPDRYYRTGDLGRMLPDGSLEHLGRGDSLAKVKGRQVDLAAIEQALCQLPHIRHALVALDDRASGAQLVAYLVTNEQAEIVVSDLRAALSGKIADWTIPSHFVFLDEIPVDRHGKVVRQLLPARSNERPRLVVPYQAPKSLMEKQLAECFADVLQIRPVGIHDSFFDLGGDSLSATAITFEIEKKFEVSLAPELIFDHPTVSTLASQLRNNKQMATAYPLRSVGSRPPVFCVHVYHHFASGYRRLAELLGEDQPVYVLRDSPPLLSVEEIASSFLKAMERIQPTGPYHICGACFSGTVAYEMAAQLERKGESVGFVGLLDSAFPPRKGASSKYPVIVPRTSRWHHFSRSRLAKLAVELGLPVFRSWIKLHHAIEIAESRYRPRSISSDVVLFAIGQLDNQVGWKSLCGDRFTTVSISDSILPATQYRPHLTDEPYVAKLALSLAPNLRN